ncbi:MAG: uncharacterized protein FD123_2520 [Bacteroidetes bacterium]|nr:MAG: uncharacterized protein FD123_2520 [Bacteroidota bacterium]
MTRWWHDITFANPGMLWLLLGLIPVLAWYVVLQFIGRSEVHLSSARFLRGVGKPAVWYFQHVFFALRLFAFSLLILIAARPQSRSEWKKITTEGIDIVMAIDVSPSMLSKDFKPNRLEAAKDAAARFVDERFSDRIGTVVFSGEAFTLCPLTIDHPALKIQLSGISCGDLDQGTAIGMGLAMAVKRIKDSKAKSKVIIPGKALSPVAILPGGQYQYDYIDVDIDEQTLTAIAEKTGGKYFRATDKENLEKIYAEIDRMEKTAFDSKQHSQRKEEYFGFALAAAIILLIDFIFRNTLLASLT